jgi:tetratricopeptide (TPR) repeat protein
VTADAHATFSLRSAQEKLGLSRTVLARLIADGFITPAKGPRNAHRFTFQDLTLLRTAYALQQSGIPPRKILQSLAKLKAELPQALPLTGLRITAVGADVAVRGRQGRLEATSGQLLMDFEVSASGASVSFLDRRASQPQPGIDPTSLLRRGEHLEAAGDPVGAEQAYREALALAPDFADAYLNLGAMWCEAGRCDEAVTLYDTAVARCPGSPWVWFNRAIALEDQRRLDDAMVSYEKCLQLDRNLADAHFNLGRLREKLGDSRGALRHFNAYRRLRP